MCYHQNTPAIFCRAMIGRKTSEALIKQTVRIGSSIRVRPKGGDSFGPTAQIFLGYKTVAHCMPAANFRPFHSVSSSVPPGCCVILTRYVLCGMSLMLKILLPLKSYSYYYT